MEKLTSFFSGNLKQSEGRPEYEEKTALVELFKDRLKLYGFQLARPVVVIGIKSPM